MNKNFYRAFEDRFRGARETIKSRLMVYLPFIEPLKEIYNVCSAIDLGCGRGEWLELMTEVGVNAHGIDMDEGMLAACRELELSVENGDAISFLKSLPDQSQTIISGFHIIEHIAFGELQSLIQEAFRVLKPAGLLILETPNPESIVVSSTSFYLDPTHLHPIPPQLLSFLTEYAGFCRNKILRLQEPNNPTTNTLPNLFQVLYGVSPDYSVIAQKKITDEFFTTFDPVFHKEHGLSLEMLSANYDVQVTQAFDNYQSRLNDIQVTLNEVQTALNNIYRSRSWRITAPLRASIDVLRTGKNTLRDGKSRFASYIVYRFRIFLYSTARIIRKIPFVSVFLRTLKNYFPQLWARLRGRGINDYPHSHQSISPHFLVEDEDHFLRLFQRELSRRRNNSKTE